MTTASVPSGRGGRPSRSRSSIAVTTWPRRLIRPATAVGRQRHAGQLLAAEHLLHVLDLDAVQVAVQPEGGELPAGGGRLGVGRGGHGQTSSREVETSADVWRGAGWRVVE